MQVVPGKQAAALPDCFNIPFQYFNEHRATKQARWPNRTCSLLHAAVSVSNPENEHRAQRWCMTSFPRRTGYSVRYNRTLPTSNHTLSVTRACHSTQSIFTDLHAHGSVFKGRRLVHFQEHDSKGRQDNSSDICNCCLRADAS